MTDELFIGRLANKMLCKIINLTISCVRGIVLQKFKILFSLQQYSLHPQ